MSSLPIEDKTGFYTAEGQCIICHLPPEIAPSLIGFYESPDGNHANSTCFFKRQPTNPKEVELAIEAMHSSCVEAIRYGGDNLKIIKQLIEMNLEHCVDALSDGRRVKILSQI